MLSSINCVTTRSIYVSIYEKVVCFFISININLKVNIVTDGCTDIIVAAIGNISVEVSWTDMKFTFVGFDYYISRVQIPIGYYLTFVGFPYGTIIYHLNET